MEKKTSGRRRLEMQPIGEESRRHVAFSKRKAGIFNKAAELSVLTGAEVVVIVFSKHGKAYTFSTPGGDAALSSLLGGGAAPRVPAAAAAAEFAAARRELRRLEDLERRTAEHRGRERAGGFWWDRAVGCGGDRPEELEKFLEALLDLRRMVADRAAAAAAEAEGPFLSLLNGDGEDVVNGMITGSPSSEVYN